jgi:ABC-type dipeptide/oligopeptide/nickel transport system permease subunit
MAEQSTISNLQTEDYALDEEKKKPWHVKLVSYGAFILLSLVLLIFIDLVTGALGATITIDILEMETAESQGIILFMRASGMILLGLSLIIGRFRFAIYERQNGRMLQDLLLVGILLGVLFAVNIGIGILAFFFVFFWEPKFTEQWQDRTLKIYRFAIAGSFLVWLTLESFLSEGWIGTALLPRVLTRSLSEIFIESGLGPVTFWVAVLIMTAYLLLPKAFYALWGFRKSIETFWREFVYEPMGMVGLIIIATIVIVAVFAPFIATHHWSVGSFELEDLLAPPSLEHIMGTNHIGQDIFSRMIYGAQISLLVGFLAAIIAVTIGTTVGLISGYFGGFTDTILMRITDLFLSLPTLPLMLIMLALFGQGLQNVIIVIAILGWTGTARMVRSEALSLRERPLTEAAHALGANDMYILFRHIFPNTLPLVLANMILGVVNAILSEAGIAFLGFVDIHGQPSWGIILHWASKSGALLNNMWWWIVPPGLLIMMTTLGFVFVSHAADKVVNPRLRGRR